MSYAGNEGLFGGRMPSRAVQVERLKAVHESVRELNATLLKAMELKDELVKKYDVTIVKKHLKAIKPSIDNVVEELRRVNSNLSRLRTQSGIIQMALSGDAGKIIDSVAGSIDELNRNIVSFMDDLMENKSEKDKDG